MARRSAIYDYIVSFRIEHGFSPTIRDICRGVGIKSTSTAYEDIEILIAEGRLTGSGPARTLVPADMPGDRIGTLTASMRAISGICRETECGSCPFMDGGCIVKRELAHIYEKETR